MQSLEGRDVLVAELTKRIGEQEDSCMALVEVNSELQREVLLVQETLNMYMSKYESGLEEKKEGGGVESGGEKGGEGGGGGGGGEVVGGEGVGGGGGGSGSSGDGGDTKVADGASSEMKAMSMNEISHEMSSRGTLDNDPNVLNIITHELDAIEQATDATKRTMAKRTAWHVMTSYRGNLRSIFNKYCTRSVYASRASTPTSKMSIESKLQSASKLASKEEVGEVTNNTTDTTIDTTTDTTTNTTASITTTRQRRALVVVMGVKEFVNFAREYDIAGNLVPHVGIRPLFERNCHQQDPPASGGRRPTSSSTANRGGGVMYFSEFQQALLELAEIAYDDVTIVKNLEHSTTCLGRLLFHIDQGGNLFKGLSRLIKEEKSKRTEQRAHLSVFKTNNKHNNYHHHHQTHINY